MNDAIIPFLLHVKDTNNIPIYTPLDSAFLKQHQLSTTATTEALEKIEDTLKKEWYENLINTLALVVTLWIFIKQYRSDAKDRIRNTNQNWYMNVIIQPNLPEINGYYEELMRLFMKHIVISRTFASSRLATLYRFRAWFLLLTKTDDYE